MLTGANVVPSCGNYTKYALPQEVVDESEAILTENLMNEIRYGIGDTGIRPGVIGEIGITPNIQDWDEKTLRIAAKPHREAGLPVYIHTQAVPLVPGFAGNPNGVEVLQFLERVVICHVGAQSKPDYQREVLKTGAYLEFDHFGEEFYVETADFLMNATTTGSMQCSL